MSQVSPALYPRFPTETEDKPALADALRSMMKNFEIALAEVKKASENASNSAEVAHGSRPAAPLYPMVTMAPAKPNSEMMLPMIMLIMMMGGGGQMMMPLLLMMMMMGAV